MNIKVSNVEIDGDKVKLMLECVNLEKDLNNSYDLRRMIESVIVENVTKTFLHNNLQELLNGIDMKAVQNLIAIQTAAKTVGAR